MLTHVHKQAHSIAAPHFLFSTRGMAENIRRFLWWSNPHVRHLYPAFSKCVACEVQGDDRYSWWKNWLWVSLLLPDTIAVTRSEADVNVSARCVTFWCCRKDVTVRRGESCVLKYLLVAASAYPRRGKLGKLIFHCQHNRSPVIFYSNTFPSQVSLVWSSLFWKM